MRQFKPILALCSLLLCLSLPAWAATYTQVATGAFGTALTGQATNVRFTVYDSAGTVQIAATNAPSGNAIGESADAAASSTTGTYIARFTCDTAWLPIHVKFTIVGQVGVAASAIIGSDRAAALADGLSSSTIGNINSGATSAGTAATQATTAATQSTSANTQATAANGKLLGNIAAQTGDAYARLGAPVGASISADIAANPALVWGVATRQLTGTQTFNNTGTWTGNLTGSVGSVTGNVGGNLLGSIGGYASGQDPATLVLGATATSWNTALTIGNKINSAASAGDPWTAALPGSYGAGSAGAILAGLKSTAPAWWIAPYTDYQQRGVAVTLPTSVVPSGDITSIITAQQNTVVDGTLTKKQLDSIAANTALESDRTWNATTHTAVVLWYRRNSGALTADKTKPIKTLTTVYDSTNVQVVSQTIVLSNLP